MKKKNDPRRKAVSFIFAELQKRTAIARMRRNCHTFWLFCFLFFLTGTVQAVVPDPGGTNTYPWLDSWSFVDTNYWTSDLNYLPRSYNNLDVSFVGPGNSLFIDSTNAAWLKYNVYEETGATNLNIVSDGSLMFWLAPNWASTSDTNDAGTGPGVWSRLIEVGSYTTNASYGWWSLYLDDAGDNIYFSSQSDDGSATNYLSAPITFTSNVWHLIALTWTSTNTSLYVDGGCITNGPGISVLPNSTLISDGFTIGSDADTGMLQMRAAMNSLTTYNYALDSGTIGATWLLSSLFYYRNPDSLGNFANPSYSPGISSIYDVVSGPGYLQVTGTNVTDCFSNANVWITNTVATPATNNSINLSFMVMGGDSTLPYDVFATSALVNPSTNGFWSWLGQAYPCQTNNVNGLTNRSVYLQLGTPIDSDGDGLTDAFERLMTHTDPNNPSSAGDGIADGWKLLAGLSLTNAVGVPTLNPASTPTCP